MSDWRTEARGIPVWDGAAALRRHPDDTEWTPCRIVRIREWGNLFYDKSGEGQGFTGDYTFIPDLDDSDTLAAFDPRLATRLGAPEEAVRDGVLVYVVGQGPYGVVQAGPSWKHPFEPAGDDPGLLLTRVRLWQRAA